MVIGIAGVNHYAESAGTIFATEDRDLFLPPDPRNALRAWSVCSTAGLDLWCGDEPLGLPRDLTLARQVVSRQALVRAESASLRVDLTLVMAGFEFKEVWKGRRTFLVQGVRIPVARLTHIVRSKAAAGRPKDRLFLATHEEALRGMLKRKRTSR